MLKSKLRLATVYIKVVQGQSHFYKITIEISSEMLSEVAWTTTTLYAIASYNLEQHDWFVTTI